MKPAHQGHKCPKCGYSDSLAKSETTIPSYKLRLAANRAGATDTRTVWVDKAQIGSVEQFARKWRVLDNTGTAIATGEVSLEAAVGKLLKHVTNHQAEETAWPVAKSADSLNQKLNHQAETTAMVAVAKAQSEFKQAVEAYTKLFNDGVIKGRGNAAKHLAKCADALADLTGIDPLTLEKVATSDGNRKGWVSRRAHQAGHVDDERDESQLAHRHAHLTSTGQRVELAEFVQKFAQRQGRMMRSGKELTDVSDLAHQLISESQTQAPIPANADLPTVSWDSLVESDEVMGKNFGPIKPERDTWGQLVKHYGPGNHPDGSPQSVHAGGASAAEAADDAELSNKKPVRLPPFKAVAPKTPKPSTEAEDDAELGKKPSLATDAQVDAMYALAQPSKTPSLDDAKNIIASARALTAGNLAEAREHYLKLPAAIQDKLTEMFPAEPGYDKLHQPKPPVTGADIRDYNRSKRG